MKNLVFFTGLILALVYLVVSTSSREDFPSISSSEPGVEKSVFPTRVDKKNTYSIVGEDVDSSVQLWDIFDSELESSVEDNYKFVPLFSSYDERLTEVFPLQVPSEEFDVFCKVVYGNFMERINLDPQLREQVYEEFRIYYKIYSENRRKGESSDIWFIAVDAMTPYLSDTELDQFKSYQYDLLEQESEIFDYLNYRLVDDPLFN